MLIREAEEEAAKEREIEEAAKAAPCFVVFLVFVILSTVVGFWRFIPKRLFTVGG